MSDNELSRTHVVAVHGLGSHWLFMLPLVWWIRKKGFSASSFGYRSWFWSIERHANRLAKRLSQLQLDPNVDVIHLVAHSMGSIVVRAMMANQEFSKIHRVVLLSPPNGGSPAATRLGWVLPFAKTVNQISDRPEAFVHSLPSEMSAEVGIVAASYDFVIPQENTRLAKEKDHVTIFSGHNGLLVRPRAASCVVDFLYQGSFGQDQ